MKKGKSRQLTKSERTGKREKAVSFIILFLVCCVWMLPLLYMFGTSFKSEIDLQLHPELLFPSDWQEWTLDHYKEMLFQNGQVGNIVYWILNSLWSTVASVALTVILDLITAYAVVFLKFRGKNFFMKCTEKKIIISEFFFFGFQKLFVYTRSFCHYFYKFFIVER